MMDCDELRAEIARRLDLYNLGGHVAWNESQFAKSSDGTVLQVNLSVSDSSWLGPIREIVNEKCRQLEQRHQAIRVDTAFSVTWFLEKLEPIRNTADDCEFGIPLCPARRYIASVKSGLGRVSAIVDVQYRSGCEPNDADVHRFVENRLSLRNNGWNPQTEPLLMVSL